MAITRIRNHTDAPSRKLLDNDLSICEKEILLFLHTLPSAWNYSATRLSRSKNISRPELIDAMAHLEKKGYIKLIRKRNKNGCFGAVNLILYDA